MAKRSRRVPRYLRDDPTWREVEAQRQSGIPRDAIAADLSQQVLERLLNNPQEYQ